ncbi:MAG: hypothetical protein ACREQ5_15555, partial [Candidatus Dormibacteria bacterium]
QILLGKYVGETGSYLFDYTSRLAPTETLSSAVVSASVYSGVDASPGGIISGSASVVGNAISQKITAGVPGTIYVLSCVATTSAGSTLTIQGYLPVLPSQP